jgi:hypothetical protein
VDEPTSAPSQPAVPEAPSDKPIATPAGPPAVTVFQAVPPSMEELASQAGIEPPPEQEPEPDTEVKEPEPLAEPEPEPMAEPVATTDAVRHEYDAGRLVAIEIEEDGGVTRLVRGADGWSVHPG